jgi:hypothetical protein
VSRIDDLQRHVPDSVSPTLPFMLQLVELVIRHQPTELPLLVDALELLFAFLASPEGRTDVNVRYTGSFLLGGVLDKSRWAHLPQPFQDILFDAGAQLDDTFRAPEVAANFDSSPEQLLDRTQWLRARYPAT